MTPMQRTYAIAREATDAQQDVIQELRLEIASLTRGNETMHKLMEEQLAEIANLKAGGCARNQGSTQFCAEAVQLQEKMRHMVRLDDPVVTGLVEALKSANKWVVRIDDRQDDLPGSFIPFGMDPSGSVRGTRDALSAYEARVKEVGT